jgi:hypothetical protein
LNDFCQWRFAMNDPKLLTAILSSHPWTREAVARGFKPILPAAEVESRVAVLVEDMAKMGRGWPIRGRPVDENLVLSYYEVPGTDFGMLDSEDVDDAHKAHGIGLNWGSLLRLSKVCLVARRYFGPAWPKRFKKIFLDGKKHFSFIEEMLWLSLWRGVTNVEYEARPFLSHGSRKGIDLRFDSCGQKINLEVKYRPKDWMRHVDGPAHNIVMPGYFYDVPAKFRFRNDGELNLVGLTALASIDRSLRERTQILLRENPNIDGVIIWAHASVDGSPSFEIHSTKRPFIESLFAGADLEDLAHMGLVAHLWRKRDERRAFRADEVPRLLQQLAAQAQTFPPPR